MIIHVLYVCVCSVTLDLISSSIVLPVFVVIIISVIFIRNFILPGIRFIEISTSWAVGETTPWGSQIRSETLFAFRDNV